jgi:hypothetical protein
MEIVTGAETCIRVGACRPMKVLRVRETRSEHAGRLPLVFAHRTRGHPDLARWRCAASRAFLGGHWARSSRILRLAGPAPGSDPQSAIGERVAAATRHLLWVVEGVPVVVEVPVGGQEPGLEVGKAVCRRLAQHPGWVLE